MVIRWNETRKAGIISNWEQVGNIKGENGEKDGNEMGDILEWSGKEIEWDGKGWDGKNEKKMGIQWEMGMGCREHDGNKILSDGNKF